MMPMIWIVILITVLLDQASKLYVSHTFEYLQTMPLLPKLIHFTYVHNFGAAFGILQNWRWLLILVGVTAFGFVLYFYRQLPQDRFSRLALGLALGGAIGNWLDRIRLGYVVDFLEFEFIRFPVFNIADSAIVVGMILLSLKILFTREETGEVKDAGDSRI